MSDEIQYNFDRNFSSFEAINRQLNQITAAREEIGNIFKELTQWYDGDGRNGLIAAQTNIDNMLSEATDNTVSTQKAASETNEGMHMLDKMQAADFG